jgi:hypothetical protein
MKSIIKNNIPFSFLKQRRDGTNIFINSNLQFILKTGKQKNLKREYDLLIYWQNMGFRVPTIEHEIEYNLDNCWFIEKLLGNETINTFFEKEIKNEGEISQATFEPFFKLCFEFSNMQFKHQIEKKYSRINQFLEDVYWWQILEEFPQLNTVKFKSLTKRLIDFLDQSTWTPIHGDFNAHNMFFEGIIDLEFSNDGPFGYDLVSAYISPIWFPSDGGYEFNRTYSFNKEQKEVFTDTLKEIHLKQNLDITFDNWLYLIVTLRSAWFLAKINHLPKLQNWRLKKFENILINKNLLDL